MIRSTLICVCLWTRISLAADPGQLQVRNFGVVNSRLYRGGQPRLAQLADLKQAGVTLIIDLRQHGKPIDAERDSAERLGIKYINIPLPPFAAPPPAKVNAVLDLLQQNQTRTVFLHCRRGRDRTGTIVACYRIAHDGWTTQRALEEAGYYGMSGSERAMRTFVRQFVSLSRPLSPAALLQ